MRKTLLVGLDAACWEYVDPLLLSGRMPTLQSIMNKGTWGTLYSTKPAWTPTAWASIITGKNPGKHGVFDMLWRRPGTYEFTPTNATARTGTPFWRHLNNAGLHVGLVNVPFTYPPEPLDGFVVCGFGTPDSVEELTYPSDLLPWIEQEFGPYEPTVNAEFLRTAPPDSILQEEKDHQARQVQIAVRLAERFQVDVLVINLMLTDHANHKMPAMEQVYEAYQSSDQDLAQLIRAFQPDDTLLISDHGSTRLNGDFLLYAWLHDQGYYMLAENQPSERRAALNWLLVQWLQNHHDWAGLTEKILRRLLQEALYRLPGTVTERIWSKIESVIPFAREHFVWSERPDYRRTRVYPGSVYSGLLYFNRVGREPLGILRAEDRGSLVSELASKLLEIKDPDTLQPLFSNIHDSKQQYAGPAVESGPDLILESFSSGWNLRMGNLTPSPMRVRDKYFVDASERKEFGWHSQAGIFVFSGSDFLTGPAPITGQVIDIPATLLHLYGIPIPEDYDARVLTELLEPGLAQQPIHLQPGDVIASHDTRTALSPEEAAALAAHLRALGYLS